MCVCVCACVRVSSYLDATAWQSGTAEWIPTEEEWQHALISCCSWLKYKDTDSRDKEFQRIFSGSMICCYVIGKCVKQRHNKVCEVFAIVIVPCLSNIIQLKCEVSHN